MVRQLYLRGIIMNVTNPKVAIFFLAFLPQIADPSFNETSHDVRAGLVDLRSCVSRRRGVAFSHQCSSSDARFKHTTNTKHLQRFGKTFFA
jgi:hypothetical protein